MAGKAKIRIEGEDATAAAWSSAVSRANSNAKEMGHAFETAFAGVSLAAIVEVGKAAGEFGDQLSKAATKSGIGGKQMSELAYAAKLADVDISGLSTSLKKMQVAISEAETGNKQSKDAFDALGISLEQIQKLRPEDQFELIAQRISQLTDPADRARAATDLFGKAGADLLPLFEHGSEGIEKARIEAEKLGASMSGEALKRLSEFNEAGKKLSVSWHAFAATLVSEVAPGITKVLDSLSGTREAELKQQIAFLENVKGEGFVAANPLGKAGAYKDIGTGVFSAEEGAAMLAKLQGQLDLIETSKYGLGGRGRPASVPGFSATDAAEKAAAASKKAADEDAKQAQHLHDLHVSLLSDLSREVGTQADKTLKDDMEREMKRMDAADELTEKWKQSERDLAIYRDQQAEASAQKYVDFFDGAFNAMEQNGKFSIKRLGQYLLLELAQLGTDKLIKNLFNTGSSSGGGFWSGISSAVGSLFGGGGGTYSPDGTFFPGRASGGSVSAGGTYLIGERGPELLRMGSSGSIVANNKLGGSGGVNIHIDARGSTQDSVSQLTKFGREIKRQIFDELDRGGTLRTA